MEFKLEATNTDETIDPVLKLTHCKFSSYLKVSKEGKDLTSQSIFNMVIENAQQAKSSSSSNENNDDDDPCHRDYRGTIHISNNEFGVMGTADFDESYNKGLAVRGGQRLEMEDNVFGVVGDRSILLENVREIIVEDNK